MLGSRVIASVIEMAGSCGAEPVMQATVTETVVVASDVGASGAGQYFRARNSSRLHEAKLI